MTATCPNGHVSETTDYCDRCGALIDAPDEQRTPPSEVTRRSAASECPVCGTARVADDRFCESCGHDYSAAPASTDAAAAGWELVIVADRHYFERYAVQEIDFPADVEPRRLALEQTELRVGRGRPGADGPPDGIDLTGAADDPALSRLHAVIARQGDGSYTIEDVGSTNGTEVNGRALPSHDPLTLADGDRIQLGAWTTMTVRRLEGGEGTPD
jgi:FHA domain